MIQFIIESYFSWGMYGAFFCMFLSAVCSAILLFHKGPEHKNTKKM